MAKKAKWETKYNKPKKVINKKSNKTTYDIPSFSYKYTFLMMAIVFMVLWGLPVLLVFLNIAPMWPTTLLGGLICGFSVAYVQFFLEKKEGMSRNFWIVGSVLSVIIAIIIYVLYQFGLLL